MAPDPESITALGAALTAAKVAGDVVREVVAKPVGEAVSAHVKAFAEQRLLPALRRVLPVEEAARVAAADAAERLAGTPPEQLVEPAPAIAAGVVQALQTRADEPVLRAMYAELLASACRAGAAERAHLAYVEILRELDPTDALIFAQVARSPDWGTGTPGNPSVVRWGPMIISVRQFVTSDPAQLAIAAGCPTSVDVVPSLSNLERVGLVVLRLQPKTAPGTGQALAPDLVVRVTLVGERFARVCLPRVPGERG